MAFDFDSIIDEKNTGVDTTKDEEWINQSFMVSNDEINQGYRKYRYFSGVDRTYVDSSLGGSLACNPKPQFCRYGDTRRKGRLFNSRDDVSIYNDSWNVGMGQYYFESIHDNLQTLFLEFGVPRFQSMFSYLSTAVDSPMSEMANHASGRFLYDIGKAGGQALGVFFIGWTWSLIAITVFTIKLAHKMVFGSQVAKYYYLKPAMHVYWSAVNNMITDVTRELGIGKTYIGNPVQGKVGAPIEMDKEELDNVNIFYKDLMSSNGYVDIRRIIGRAQAIKNTELTKSMEMDKKKKISFQEWEEFMEADVKIPRQQSMQSFVGDVLSGTELYRSKLKTKSTGSASPGHLEEEEDKSIIDKRGGFSTVIFNKIKAAQNDSIKYMISAMKGGSRFAVFNVTPLSRPTVTFTNSTGEIPTKGALNSIGGATRNIEFSTAGANFIGVGIGEAITGAMDLMQAGLAGVTFGASNVLLALLGGGYIEMPEMWKDSEMSAQEYNFKIQLRNQYGHPIARLQNLLIPLFMILGGALPLATGKASYTSPFLCSAFLRGVVNIDMGMITKVSIISHVGNVGTDGVGHSLGYDIEFTIKDFTTILSAPISSMANGTIVNSQDEVSAISRFMQTVASRDLYTNKYTSKKAALRLNGAIQGIDKATDPAFLGTLVGDFLYPISGLFYDDVNLVRLEGH